MEVNRSPSSAFSASGSGRPRRFWYTQSNFTNREMPRLARWCSRTFATRGGSRWAKSSQNASVLMSPDSRMTPSKSNTTARRPPSGRAMGSFVAARSMQLLDHLEQALPHVDILGGDELPPRLGREGVRCDAVVAGAVPLDRAVVDRHLAAEDLLEHDEEVGRAERARAGQEQVLALELGRHRVHRQAGGVLDVDVLADVVRRARVADPPLGHRLGQEAVD